MSEPIKLTVTLDWRDYYKAGKLFVDSSKSQRYLRYTILAILLILIALTVWISGILYCDCGSWKDFWYCAEYPLKEFWFNFLLLPLVALLIMTDGFSKLVFWFAIKRSKYACSPREWVISPDNVFVSFEKAESNIKWDYFRKWLENEETFVLLHDRRMYYALPKRFFASDAEIDRFRELLKEKVKES